LGGAHLARYVKKYGMKIREKKDECSDEQKGDRARFVLSKHERTKGWSFTECCC